MTSQNKIRTVNVNERGQIVIPDDIRKDFGISANSTLVMIERDGEIVIRKEKDVIAAIDDDKFWKAISRSALEKAWSKEDEVWDKLYSETK